MTRNVLPPSTLCPLGPAWAGNAVNCMTYRQFGLVSREGRQFGCYYDADGKVVVFARDIGSSACAMITADAPALPHDAHYSLTLGIDNDGCIHVAGGAHVGRPLYLRVEEIENTLKLYTDGAGPFASDDRLSYPSFVMDGRGGLFFMARHGVPARSSWRVTQYDHIGGAWNEQSFPLISGICQNAWPAGPYLSTAVGPRDGRIGFFIVWRSESLVGAQSRVSNIGIDYLEADLASRTYTTHDGIKLFVPVTPAISERVIAIPWRRDLCNQSGATRLPDGRPFGVASWAATIGSRQIHAFWPGKTGAWRNRQVSRFVNSVEMHGKGTLYLAHSRPVCTALPDGRVVIIYRSGDLGGRLLADVLEPPHYITHPDRRWIIWDDDLGYYEPVIDTSITESTGVVSLYIQNCGRAEDNTAPPISVSSMAYVAEWKFP